MITGTIVYVATVKQKGVGMGPYWPFNQWVKPFWVTYKLSANNTDNKHQFVLIINP